MLKGDLIKLRGVEPEDVSFLFEIENDVAIWKVSETSIPFTRKTLREYAESVHDIYTQGQYRFIIESVEDHIPVGMIDLYDFNAFHRRAGVGILILEEYQGRGLAFDAIQVLINYASQVLDLNQLFCSMHESNIASAMLFERTGFVNIGRRREWFRTKNGWEDELLYQLILR